MVELPPLPGLQGEEKLKSTFINANYMSGYDGKVKYIATQGPKDETKDAFWRMVWENKTDLVVMVTGLKEDGKWKCVMYWPDSREGPGKSEVYQPSGLKATIVSVETHGCIV
jgi:protein tyrosine phosphatase